MFETEERAVYVGDWSDDRMRGSGSLTVNLPDGTVRFYTGEFRNGQMAGRGVLFATEGDYMGQLRENQYNGTDFPEIPNREPANLPGRMLS
ncbi:MAG: hypothetical protein H7A21_03810 [Spirochaetales bacterium]|nr:hypothetical protein [Spirochaetales bacterium]MCP5483887.1 hypothetical protein [Spirochaetales bacterium]